MISVPSISLPQYSITTNGTLMTEDGSDVQPGCALYYHDQMDQQAKTMAANVNALIGGEICANQKAGDVIIKSAFSNLQINRNQVSNGMFTSLTRRIYIVSLKAKGSNYILV